MSKVCDTLYFCSSLFLLFLTKYIGYQKLHLEGTAGFPWKWSLALINIIFTFEIDPGVSTPDDRVIVDSGRDHSSSIRFC